MNVFIAGGTGAIGRPLIPMLVSDGHRVVALTRSPERATALAASRAEPVLGDVFDAGALNKILAAAEPDLVIHQLTAFGATDADPLAETIRIRIEGTRNLVAAARAAGAKRFITQSISFVCTPNGNGLTDEDTPLYFEAPPAIRPLVNAIDSLERQTLESTMNGLVLRYGWFYGPGTNYDPADSIPRAIRKGRMPLLGGGHGVYSFIHVHDAAAATVRAVNSDATGVYNIVDDDPAPQHVWLPEAARLLNAPPPALMDVDLARDKLGDMMVYIMNEQRGASNAKVERDLGWTPAIPTWRNGFAREFTAAEKV